MDKIRTVFALLLAWLALFFATPTEAKPFDPMINGIVYSDAQTNSARFAKDREKDAARKPADVMQFFGFAPGMKVLDVMSGGGFTTEYLSWLVGPKGHVTALNPPAFEAFAKDEIAARFTPGRLANVDRMVTPLGDFMPKKGAYDAVIIVQDYHDLYWVKDPDWPKNDAGKLLAALHRGLASNGFVAIVDHAAAAGTGTSAAQNLHRIEKAAVIKDFEAAGFKLEKESAILANPADDHSKGVFDPAIRGKTDQFILKFVKAKK